MKRAAQVLSAVDRLTRLTGRPPSVREIGDCIGVSSTATVQAIVDHLVRHGELVRERKSPRSLRRPRSSVSDRRKALATSYADLFVVTDEPLFLGMAFGILLAEPA